MPIGKNSLKRVSNNGYSKVASSAPDMENSEINLVKEAEKHTEAILAPKTEEGKQAIARAKEKASEVAAKGKKTEKSDTKSKRTSAAAKAKETVKSMSAEAKKTTKPASKKPTETPVAPVDEAKTEEVKTTEKEENLGYVNLGKGIMPSYLL